MHLNVFYACSFSFKKGNHREFLFKRACYNSIQIVYIHVFIYNMSLCVGIYLAALFRPILILTDPFYDWCHIFHRNHSHISIFSTLCTTFSSIYLILRIPPFILSVAKILCKFRKKTLKLLLFLHHRLFCLCSFCCCPKLWKKLIFCPWTATLKQNVKYFKYAGTVVDKIHIEW